MTDPQTQPTESDTASADRRSLPLVQLLPNLVTLLGLSAGLTSIRYVLQDSYQVAAALLVLAAIIDGIDGLLARKLNAESSFGAELDSLSDFVCFGVAPGIFVYHFVLQGLPGLGWLFVLVYVICACLRLARFNVNRDAPPPPGRAHFVGVPAPAGAMLALLPVYVSLADWVDMRQWPIAVALYVGMIGLLMISRLPTPSPKGLAVPRNRAIWVLLGVGVFAGALAMRPWTVLLLTDLAYLVVLAQGSWAHRRALT
ncbi:CDP-diacylglycerol--serine O-phosphatidyltransferase [Pararhodobacter sp.]|uniref:CDP-diacylglycerol--serine O-phosphatidyltransferase n=1 Tax=Pararhodobacter sp. TaxID=2127056 RepID=UPI002AFE82BE|nr:CDP-diacylglycerol--serine O-phosphatidyltransferase [Pararhodobacter sp.]